MTYDLAVARDGRFRPHAGPVESNVLSGNATKGIAVKDRWTNGQAIHGVWACLPDPVTAELVSRAGFNYICLDLQHGMAGPSTLLPLMQATRQTPAAVFVRVPSDAGDLMMRALDLGADGIIAPLVDNAEQATAVVTACTYPPQGARSWGPMWGDVDGQAPLPEEANAAVLIAVMIETAEGLRNAEAIAAVPGLDAIYVGPNDLALSTGHGRSTYDTNPRMHAAIDRVLNACKANNIAMGLHCSTPEMAAYWHERGVQMLTIATDASLLREAACESITRFTNASQGEDA